MKPLLYFIGGMLFLAAVIIASVWPRDWLTCVVSGFLALGGLGICWANRD